MGHEIIDGNTSEPYAISSFSGSPSGLRSGRPKTGGSKGWTFFGSMAIGAVIATVVITCYQSSKADTAAEVSHVGRCFSTAIGAVGMAESANRGHAVLIFGSGNRAWYDLDTLRETPCPAVPASEGR